MKKSTSVIGVYSPVGRTQKTSFALTLGQILAKDRAVLYLNLESYSGFEQILGETYERNLSDLLYFVRQENANVIHRLSGMVLPIQNLDYVPPALSPMDIQCTSCGEWLALFEEIVRSYIRFWIIAPEYMCLSGGMPFQRPSSPSLRICCGCGIMKGCWRKCRKSSLRSTARTGRERAI